MRLRPLSSAVSAIPVAVAVLVAQPDPTRIAVAARFSKYEHAIPMRDGVRLYTAVYVPKRLERESPLPRRMATLPILLTRTPYGVDPYGPSSYPNGLGPSTLFDRGDFIIVHQDVRGRFMSEGEWVEMRPIDAAERGPGATDESTDAWDTIEWLVRNVPGNNGRVGLWGISYPGFYAAAGLVGAHPALAASSPQAPVTDYYMGDDAYHNGAFMLAANFGFYATFYPRPGGPGTRPWTQPFEYDTDDGYAFYLKMGALANATAKFSRGPNPYWDEVIEHTTYDGFWRSRAVPPRLTGIRADVLTVGGWYDTEDLQGPLRVYDRIEETSPGAVNRLVMGPWTHGSWARGLGRRVSVLDFGEDTAVFFRERIEWPFFERALRPGPAAGYAPEAWTFDTGTTGWRALDAWPPRGVQPRTFYLAADGRLSDVPPRDADSAWDEYVSDPSRPVPFIERVPTRVPAAWMAEDQRFASRRRDVLTYRTAPLGSDLTVAGPIAVSLHVATTGTDSDFVVKLIDESPDRGEATEARALPPGFQRLVRGEPFRGKFRHGFDRPQPFLPGEPDVIAFSMPDVHHTFRRGHRVMVHVQSSWFPLVDRNPQMFMEIPKASDADFATATERIYRSRQRPSSITVGVVR